MLCQIEKLVEVSWILLLDRCEIHPIIPVPSRSGPNRQLGGLAATLLLLLTIPLAASAWEATPRSRESARAEGGILDETEDEQPRRDRLEERGVAVEVVYTGEVFANLHGGRDSDDATEYRGNLDLLLHLDLEKLGLWRGGRLFVYGQNGHGEGISERHVGDLQTLSNLDAHDFTQLSELWLEQRLLGDRVRLKLGKQDANEDFSASDFGADFVNSSFGVIPTVPLPTFPDPALGAAAFIDLASWTSLGVGVFDGAPDGGESGFESSFDGEGGTFSLLEWTLTSSFGGARYPGRYRVGLWHHSARVEELGGDPDPQRFSSSYGLYLFLDQWIWVEDGGEAKEGLGVFAQFGWSPDDRSELTRYWGGGLSYTGLFPGRGEDVLGIGVAHARLSGKPPGPEAGEAETAIEIFYRAPIGPWLTLQPDLQLILDPGGRGEDALVAGLRFELGF
jgi:porin